MCERDHASTLIFFIDIKDGYMKDGARNRLREQDIKRIVDVWEAQQRIL
nr:N-6 DNA methylase [uncultured Porphyromonas sp.]